ncbi:MAG: hypothetical protein HY695_19235 [Deltaproteobacteria bacterium]|nr:hypothetical protein [Deltaproteobacteria bacterium]
MYGIRENPLKPELPQFKPYRPERRPVTPGERTPKVDVLSEGNFPRPPGPAVEVSLLEELKSLKGEIDKFRTSILERFDGENNEADEVLSSISELRNDVRSVSAQLDAVTEKLKKDEQALKEQSPIDLLGIVSAGGFRYALLRTDAGEKRVSEGDKVGPWMVEEIGTKEVRLSTPTHKRILALR